MHIGHIELPENLYFWAEVSVSQNLLTWVWYQNCGLKSGPLSFLKDNVDHQGIFLIVKYFYLFLISGKP